MDRYEDFEAWKFAHALNMKVWEMTSRAPAVNDFKFRDNIRDAADSAERNFPEGFGRFGPKEFARFLDHSRASLLETKNELRVGLRRGYFNEADVRDAQRLTDRALGALSGLQRYLRSPRAQDNARRIRERDLGRETARRRQMVDEPRPITATNKQGTEEPTNRETLEPANRESQEPTNPRTKERTNPRTHEPTN